MSELPALKIKKGMKKLDPLELTSSIVVPSLHETPTSGYALNAITSTKHSRAKNRDITSPTGDDVNFSSRNSINTSI